jgi:hypothetical protein
MNSPRLQAWELGIKTIYLGRSRPLNWLSLKPICVKFDNTTGQVPRCF